MVLCTIQPVAHWRAPQNDLCGMGSFFLRIRSLWNRIPPAIPFFGMPAGPGPAEVPGGQTLSGASQSTCQPADFFVRCLNTYQTWRENRLIIYALKQEHGSTPQRLIPAADFSRYIIINIKWVFLFWSKKYSRKTVEKKDATFQKSFWGARQL